MKDEGRRDFDKKKHIEGILGPFTREQFAQLVNLSKKITDYSADDEIKTDPNDEWKEAEIDEEGGVAVVIDEEEPEDEEEEDYEIRDESDEEGEEDDRDEQEDVSGEAPEEDVIIGGGASRKSTSEAEKDIVSPHAIDGFWVQQRISKIYPDRVTAADKAASVINMLDSNSSKCTRLRKPANGAFRL